MDGSTLVSMLNMLLNEPGTSTFLDVKSSYDFLYEAALEYNRLTQQLNSTQTITTVASTAAYRLNPDFLCNRLYNDRNELVIEYTVSGGTNISFLPFRPYEQVFQALNSTAVAVPANFAVTDYETIASNITGTSTAGSTGTTLVASGSTFVTSGVAVGDFIHNTTDGYDGIVTAVTNETTLTAPTFASNIAQNWGTSKAFTIVPQGRKNLVLDPAPSGSGDTVTVKYVQKPVPVYSSYASYRFDTTAMFAITKYAAWLYKYRDREPNFGDAFYKFWLAQVSAATALTNKMYDRTRFRANFIKRSLFDRSFR